MASLSYIFRFKNHSFHHQTNFWDTLYISFSQIQLFVISFSIDLGSHEPVLVLIIALKHMMQTFKK